MIKPQYLHCSLHSFRLILLCMTIYCGLSCQRIDYYHKLNHLMKSTIDLPSELLFIQNGIMSDMPSSIKESALLLVYIDSLECTDCRIRQLIRYDPIIKLSERVKSFEVLFILSPPEHIRKTLPERLLASNLPYSIAIDPDGSFMEMNPRIPSEPIFHSMLLNCMGKPVFVGDPTNGSNTYDLFYSKVKDL